MRRSLKICVGIGAVVLIGAAFNVWLMRPGSLPDCDARDYVPANMAAVRAIERPKAPDSVTTATIKVDAAAATVWDIVEHFETVWPESNPAHIQTCVATPPEAVHEDMIYHDVERVGGITATMYAHVYDVEPPHQFRWKAIARYNLGIVTLPVKQGGTFSIEPEGGGVRITHEVWADFPNSTGGQFAKWIARTFLSMEESAIEHNRLELEYFRDRAEIEA